MSEQDHIIETFSEMASRYENLMNSELNRLNRYGIYSAISHGTEDSLSSCGWFRYHFRNAF